MTEYPDIVLFGSVEITDVYKAQNDDQYRSDNKRYVVVVRRLWVCWHDPKCTKNPALRAGFRWKSRLNDYFRGSLEEEVVSGNPTNNEEGHNVEDLDHRVNCRTCSILVRITDGVTGNSCLVSI